MNLNDIINIEDGNEFINKLVFYIMEKQKSKSPLTEGENYIDFYIRFMTDKDMNGFCDLFYQEFSLEECKKIIYWFACLDLEELSEKFKKR